MRANINTKFNHSSNDSNIFSGMKVGQLNKKSQFRSMFTKKARFDSNYLEYWITNEKRYAMPCGSRKEAMQVVKESKVRQGLVFTGSL